MTDTTKNLKEAFAGESQANQKYRAFAKKAEKDGFANIARLVDVVLSKHNSQSHPTLDEIIAADKWARETALKRAGEI